MKSKSLRICWRNSPATIAGYLHVQGWAGHSSENITKLAKHGQLWRFNWLWIHTAAGIWHLVWRNWKAGQGLPSPLPLDRGCSNPSTAVSKLICPDSPFQAVNENYSGEYCKNAALMWKLECLFWGSCSHHRRQSPGVGKYLTFGQWGGQPKRKVLNLPGDGSNYVALPTLVLILLHKCEWMWN